MADLIKEMEIMKTIGQHTNLRGLLGCCTQNGKCFFLASYGVGIAFALIVIIQVFVAKIHGCGFKGSP